MILAITLVALLQCPQLNGHTWNGGDQAIYHIAPNLDISVGEFEGRVGVENRQATLRRSKTNPNSVNLAIDRFKILDSTRKSPGTTLDVVRIGSYPTPERPPIYEDFKVGKRYLLVTCPQQDNGLVDIGSPDSVGIADLSKQIVDATLPSGTVNEEVCKVVMPTEPKSLHQMGNVRETLAASVFDCLNSSDKNTFLDAFYFLTLSGNPEPTIDPYKESLRVAREDQGESAVSRALRAEAQKKSTTPGLRVAIYQILNTWRVAGTVRPLLQSFADAASDPEACPEGTGGMGFPLELPPTELGGYPPQPNLTIQALDHAQNKSIILFFLDTAWHLTLDQEKKLSVWLDSPDADIRFAAVHHFSKSLKKPDLMPQELLVNGIVTHPDLGEKVDAWKGFFGMSS